MPGIFATFRAVSWRLGLAGFQCQLHETAPTHRDVPARAARVYFVQQIVDGFVGLNVPSGWPACAMHEPALGGVAAAGKSAADAEMQPDGAAVVSGRDAHVVSAYVETPTPAQSTPVGSSHVHAEQPRESLAAA
jgi:hypothetical protein